VGHSACPSLIHDDFPRDRLVAGSRERRRRLEEEALSRKPRESPHAAIGANPGADIAGDRILKTSWGVSCGEVHSQAREMVTRGYRTRLSWLSQ